MILPILRQMIQKKRAYVFPKAGSVIAEPDPAAPKMADPVLDTISWHNWQGNGFDSFIATIVAPHPLDFHLSDGRIIKTLLTPHDYADPAALQTEIMGHLTGEPDIRNVLVYVNGGRCWIGVETVAPLYCTAISGETGNAFPEPIIGGKQRSS